MAAGMIPNIASGDNEFRTAWVAENDWVYSREFNVDGELLGSDCIVLECDGLDTLSTIRLNGEEIGRTDNMHRQYGYDVAGRILADKTNAIEIEFASPVKAAAAHVTDDSLVITPGDSMAGSPFIRKAMYQWGWDWAPKVPTSGIWRSIRLVGYCTARMRDVHVRQEHRDGRVEVKVSVETETFSGKPTVVPLSKGDHRGSRPLRIRATLTSPEGNVFEQTVDNPLSSGTPVLTTILVEHPELWWPNGYGDQALYDLDITLEDETRVLDSRSMRIGLRTIELRQEEDEWGRSFVFVVNGIPIFCKGANWIPADQFPARVTDARYKDLIASAASAHMNMLRVWGGGIYEDDRFYDLCDEHGLLIWQDFMFAGAHYPHDEEFLENVRLELVDNIRRIRHHPCLALWCGNNEMEVYLAADWVTTGDDRRQREYLDLFYRLVPEVAAAEDPDTPYWASSPASKNPLEDPNGELSGDGHYWEVWHGGALFTAYREHYYRFMSEFGYQSLPSMSTIAEFAEPRDWNIVSRVMEIHQKSHVGNGRIVNDLMKTLRLPESFPMMVYASQVLQAEAIRYGVEHWRRNRNDSRCMGALYWQLNDCWPVSSWSGIDYCDNWKALHYAAKRFFAPVLLSAEESSTGAAFHVTNDRLEPFEGRVRWALERLNGIRVDTGEIEVKVPPMTDMLVANLDYPEVLSEDARRDTVLLHSLWEGNNRLSLSVLPFVQNKYLDLLEPGIYHDVEEDESGRINIQMAAHYTARFVMLEVPGSNVRFSDNFFDLPAGRLVSITVDSEAGLSADELAAKLRVVSLRDSY
jgi:beta-mannosidase